MGQQQGSMKRASKVLLHDSKTDIGETDIAAWQPFAQEAGAIRLSNEWHSRLKLLIDSGIYRDLDTGKQIQFPDPFDNVLVFQYSSADDWFNQCEIWAEVKAPNWLEMDFRHPKEGNYRITYCGAFTVFWAGEE